MYIQDFEEEEYKRSYPTYKTVRLSYRNLDKIRRRATKYKQTIDEIVTEILQKLEQYEKPSYGIG
jgi:hypothetical protein